MDAYPKPLILLSESITMSRIKTDYRITKNGLLYRNDLIIKDEANLSSTKRKRLLRAVLVLEEAPNSLYSVDKYGFVSQTLLEGK